MIAFASTIDEMIARLEAMKRAGAKFVAVHHTAPVAENWADGLVQIELVYCTPGGAIVGDEANDYRPMNDEVCVALIS